MRLLGVGILAILGLASASVVAGSGQSHGAPPIMSPVPSDPNASPLGKNDPASPDPFGAKMEEQRMKSRNSDRQKRLESDTDRLVTLVKQLKDDVDTSDKPLQPNDVEKRAEEIEKLARSVKDRMKG
jgi:hypothetical protein